jgi:hypothetical protein
MMKSSTTTATMLLLLVSLLQTNLSYAFSISPNYPPGRDRRQGTSSSPTSSSLLASTIDSRLFYRDNGDFDNESLPITSSLSSTSLRSVATARSISAPSAAAAAAAAAGLSPLEVPTRSSASSDDSMLQDSVADQVEMTLGRLAMVAAVMFLGTELFTGQSLPEQILRLLSQHH